MFSPVGKEGVAPQTNLAFLRRHHENSVCSFFTVIDIIETLKKHIETTVL